MPETSFFDSQNSGRLHLDSAGFLQGVDNDIFFKLLQTLIEIAGFGYIQLFPILKSMKPLFNPLSSSTSKVV